MKFFLLLVLFISYVFAWEECRYPSIKDEGFYTLFDDCSKITKNHKLEINTVHLSNIDFNKDDFICIYVDTHTPYYYHKNGTSQKTFWFDNGCDYFNENGLARAIIDNKISYINKNLEVVLKTDFFYATRFYKNKAIVCDDTVKKVYEGEHSSHSGGKCNVIDLKSELLLKKSQSFEVVLKLLRNNSIK